jgi:hypothetical protein
MYLKHRNTFWEIVVEMGSLRNRKEEKIPQNFLELIHYLANASLFRFHDAMTAQVILQGSHILSLNIPPPSFP